LDFVFLVWKIWKIVLESESSLLGGSIFLNFSIFLLLIAFLGFGYFRGIYGAWFFSFEYFENGFGIIMPTFGIITFI